MSTEETRFFQFLAGERQGEVLVFDRIEEDEGDVYLCFKDKSRCNEELILPINQRTYTSELMAEVENATNIWTFDVKYVGRQEEKWSAPEDAPDGVSHLVQIFVEGKKKTTPIPPRKSKAKFGAINKHIEAAPPKEEKKKNQYEGDPVWLMMEKSKKNDTEINMSLIISLPSKSLFNVIQESFEDGDKKAISFIIDQIDDVKIKEGLEEALFLAYKNEEILENNLNNTQVLEIPTTKESQTQDE